MMVLKPKWWFLKAKNDGFKARMMVLKQEWMVFKARMGGFKARMDGFKARMGGFKARMGLLHRKLQIALFKYSCTFSLLFENTAVFDDFAKSERKQGGRNGDNVKIFVG